MADHELDKQPAKHSIFHMFIVSFWHPKARPNDIILHVLLTIELIKCPHLTKFTRINKFPSDHLFIKLSWYCWKQIGIYQQEAITNCLPPYTLILTGVQHILHYNLYLSAPLVWAIPYLPPPPCIHPDSWHPPWYYSPCQFTHFLFSFFSKLLSHCLYSPCGTFWPPQTLPSAPSVCKVTSLQCLSTLNSTGYCTPLRLLMEATTSTNFPLGLTLRCHPIWFSPTASHRLRTPFPMAPQYCWLCNWMHGSKRVTSECRQLPQSRLLQLTPAIRPVLFRCPEQCSQ